MPGREADRLVDNRRVAHAAIATFLAQQGYTESLSSFRNDAAKAGWSWEGAGTNDGEEVKEGDDCSVRLESLIELHHANMALQKQQRIFARRLLSKSPAELTLPGPPTLDFSVAKTHASLHDSNILHLTAVELPTCSFSTSEAKYITSVRRLLCSTAADKRIVLSDPDNGEMVEVFEPGSGSASNDRHNAAVLWTAQSPNKVHHREFVSCGMDGKVIVWDLLHRQPIQVLRHHTKFVVKCAFSPSGEFLASCSYDKTVCIYRRRADIASNRAPVEFESEEEECDDEGISPALNTRFELVHTVTTTSNPEAIIFVRAATRPSKNDAGLDRDEIVIRGAGSFSTAAEEDEVQTRRTWLVYTVRSDSFLHYVALPLDADQTDDDDEVANVSSRLSKTNFGQTDDQATPAWTQLSFNTNENRNDFHSSYSLLHMTLHPSGQHLAIQTGDHSIPTTGYAASSSSLSRVLIMPLLSSLRCTTLWTGIESTGFATIRHDWLPDGSAAWLTSEEGYVRLIDTKGKTRAKVAAHGAVADGEDELRRSATWTRGGNSLIKSLVVLDDKGTVATCGYDRTIRVISRA